MDECPESITDDSIRRAWAVLPAAARAEIISDYAARLQQARTHQPTQTGMPPPSGDPYPREHGRSGTGEGGAGGGRRSSRSRERSRSPRRRRVEEPPIDPALAREPRPGTSPQEAANPGRVRGRRPALYAARGGLRRRLARTETDDSTNEDARARWFCPDPNAPKDDSDPSDLYKKKMNELDNAQVVARVKIRNTVKSAFRDVTGVDKPGVPWPKWGEPVPAGHMPVNFEAKVDQSVNKDLIKRVAAVAMQEIKDDAENNAAWLNAPSVKLTDDVLRAFAKTTFRGFKDRYKGQFDPEKAAQLQKNDRASRWQNRRNAKWEDLHDVAAPEYVKMYGVDPRPFLTPDMMSDEASGPEEGGDESKMEWQHRMAERAGIVGRTDTQLSKMTFYENIAPNWRSEKLTRLLRRLYDIWWDTLSKKAVRAMGERVRNTGRSSDTVPLTAPFNFGISHAWFERFKDQVTHHRFLKDWFTYTDPPGFGESADPENALPPEACAT
ncbi:hypothetical protein C8T65DRAFT_707075 [Cerioporus squamosus]|nr:hypothetical protein C8T65DRAFT_707075 [Cerioporus squamosus]